MPGVFTKALRQAYLLFGYTAGLSLSLWLSFLLRFDFAVAPEYLVHFEWLLITIVAIKLLLLLSFGQFGSLLSYFGFYDLGKILVLCAIASGLALALWFFKGVPYAPPRAVVLTDFLISFLFLCGFRISLRLVREGYFDKNTSSGKEKFIAIIGAGDVGATLARDLLMRRGRGMIPKVFFDDDRAKWGTTIHGVTVQGAPESLRDYLHRHKVDEIIIAMPSASGRRLREIVSLLNQLQLHYEIVPSYEQLLSGRVKVSQIRAVEIQDLLGREPVSLQTERIRALVQDKVVLVTGAGGSIGSELCRQIASYAPSRLLLVERSEYLLFQIEQELIDLGLGTNITPLVVNITDQNRIEGIFKRFKPAVVFHAAAHKHVPMMEQQPAEAFSNNTLGTRLLANLAVTHGVDRFVLISTDKAINPTNVMGATKRMAELYLQALQGEMDGEGQRAGGMGGAGGRGQGAGGREEAKGMGQGAGTLPVEKIRTKLMAVRFGNVLGSSGSVIPTFKKQIAAGGPVTVTHPDMTRYFMTVNEAVGLVLQSATLGQGGEIFVLDMGQPMKIVDLARQLIELSGLEPDTDIEIKFSGLRPGEKLFEELNHKTENMVATEHPKVMRFLSEPQTLAQIQAGLDAVQKAGSLGDSDQFKLTIKSLVPEYQPYLRSAEFQ